MLSATFHDRGGRANDPDFSVYLNRSTATFRTPEILYIIRRNWYTSQGDPDSIFPYLPFPNVWVPFPNIREPFPNVRMSFPNVWEPFYLGL